MIPKAKCKLGWHELEESEEIHEDKRLQHQTHTHTTNVKQDRNPAGAPFRATRLILPVH